jgi:hypothetical protein
MYHLRSLRKLYQRDTTREFFSARVIDQFILINSYLFLSERISELNEYIALEFIEEILDSIPNDWDFCKFLN